MYTDIKCYAMQGENQVSRFVPDIRGVKQVFGFSPYLYMMS